MFFRNFPNPRISLHHFGSVFVQKRSRENKGTGHRHFAFVYLLIIFSLYVCGVGWMLMPHLVWRGQEGNSVELVLFPALTPQGSIQVFMVLSEHLFTHWAISLAWPFDFFFFLKARSCHAGLAVKLTVLLLQHPTYWNYRLCHTQQNHELGLNLDSTMANLILARYLSVPSSSSKNGNIISPHRTASHSVL